MPRNKVLERAKVSMPSGRSPFDLSQIRSYDALAGDINVCYAQPMVAGTKGEISRQCFTRTSQVVAPAFHSVTEHFDFFIVPIHALWRSWENWKVNINDLQDTLTVPMDSNYNTVLNLPSNAPRTDFNGLIPRSFKTSVVYTSESAANSEARLANDALRLCDSLNYDEAITNGISVGNSRVMNLFMLAAYQKCYYDHYRNTAYEANDPYAYNLDWLVADSTRNGLLSPDAQQATPSNPKDIAVARRLLKLHRVNYRNDYFHNIYPNLNYVSSAITGSSLFSLPSNVTGASVSSNATTIPYLVYTRTQNIASPGIYSGYVANDNVAVTTQQIRAIFALDKLMRASAYAPKHVRDQYKALYGVDGVEDPDMLSERIGSFQSDVSFQEVTNMAVTQTSSGGSTIDNNLGDLGAKGIGGQRGSDKLKFYCQYDSIVIGLHYFLPRARYDAFGIHPFNIKIDKFDFFVRAFEHLGLRPFYASYINGGSSTSTVIGWTEANFEYKVLPDLNTGQFKRKFASAEVSSSSGSYSISVSNQHTSKLSCFVPHNEQVLVSGPATADYFKVASEDLDNIFKVATPATHSKNFCQFFGEYRINCAIVAPMSVHSQPTL